LSNVKAKGTALRSALDAEFNQNPHIGDIRGRGLFLGVEFVEDCETKASFSPELKIAARLKTAAMQEGLICYPMAGTIDGKMGDHVLIAPPFIMGDEHVDELVGKLSKAVKAVLI